MLNVVLKLIQSHHGGPWDDTTSMLHLSINLHCNRMQQASLTSFTDEENKAMRRKVTFSRSLDDLPDFYYTRGNLKGIPSLDVMLDQITSNTLFIS